MEADTLNSAHGSSAQNEKEIGRSTTCGCFYCETTFAPISIVEWIDSGEVRTAICPFCGVDSVIGDASGRPVTDEKFLSAMHERWFGDAQAR